MALYVDSAYLPDIIQIARLIPIAGVTMNPTLLLRAQERGQQYRPHELLQELVAQTAGLIFMQPGASSEEDIYEQALDFIQIAPDRVIPKIVMTEIGIRVARRLQTQHHRLAFTAVNSVAQAYSATLLNADYIIPYYNRLVRQQIDANKRLMEMGEVIGRQAASTRILAASIKSPEEAMAALLAGSHDLTVIPEVARGLVTDPQTEAAVEQFAHDWQRVEKEEKRS